MTRVLFACALTLLVDLGITEIWLDLRPAVIPGVAAKRDPFLARCDMEDGVGVDYAVLWFDHKPKCVNLRNTEHRG